MKLPAFTVTQLITNLSVLIGVVVLIYEVRQSNIIAQSQLASDAYLIIHQTLLATTGEELPKALTGACYDADSLTDQDKVVLLGYFDSLWINVQRIEAIRSLGFAVPVEGAAFATVRRIAATPVGMKWYQMNRQGMSPEVRKAADESVKEFGPNSCADYLDEMGRYSE